MKKYYLGRHRKRGVTTSQMKRYLAGFDRIHF